MNKAYEPHLVKEFHDLLAISILKPELKASLTQKVEANELDEAAFSEILNLLREEDQIDKEMHQQYERLANFNPDQYLAQVQKVVDEEIKKVMRN